MSGSKLQNNPAAAILGKQIMFSKPSKSGKLRTLRRTQKITDYDWNQITVSSSTTSASASVAASQRFGSGRSSTQNVFQSFSQITSQSGPSSSISQEQNAIVFPKAQVGRPTMMFNQPPKISVINPAYVSEASVSLKPISSAQNTASVDDEAMQKTEKMFKFLWDNEPSANKETPHNSSSSRIRF